MKNLLLIAILLFTLFNCKTTKTDAPNKGSDHTATTQDTIRIANDDIEYEVIIIEAGFDSWMARRARPKSFYTQSFLEARNVQYVTEWNRRVVSSGYNGNLYEMHIDYSPSIDYGYDVNYMLYHYFVFFEEKYNQKLTTHNPRF